MWPALKQLSLEVGLMRKSINTVMTFGKLFTVKERNRKVELCQDEDGHINRLNKL